MDKTIKQQMVKILSQRIQGENQRGYCPLSLVPKLLRDGGITTENYFGGSKPKLKAWMEKEFKDKFLVLGPATGEIVVIRSKLTHLLTEGLGKYPGLREEGWSMLLPKVGELLIAGEIEYTKPLKDWFRNHCPCFAVDDDRLILANSAPAAPASSDPQKISSDTFLETKQLYFYLYMPWNSCAERLKELLGQDPPLNFKSVIARQFGSALLGKPGILLDAREDAFPRMALNSGLSTPDGNPIYCILERNQLPEGDSRQSWKLTGYCYPGEESGSGLGVWLKSRFSLYKPDETVDLSGIIHQLDELSALRASLLPALKQYVQELDGQNAPSAELSSQVAGYEGAWRALRESWNKTRILEPMEGKDLSELKGMTDAGLNFTRSLKSILDGFEQLAEMTEQVLSDKKIAPPYTPSADAKLLHERYDNAKEDVSLDLLEETLDHYEDLARIMSCKNLSDDASRYIQRSVQHFTEISLRMAVFFIDCWEDGERLEERLSEIRKLLSACQTQQRKLLASQMEASPALNPKKLLALLLSDSADWHYRWPEYAASALPGEPLAQALALNRLGDAEKLLAQAGGNAPCVLPDLPLEQTYFGAAQRLVQTIGNQGQIAESYLLLGAFFDPEHCVPALLELYRQEDRAEDFIGLAEKFEASLPLSLEDRCFYLSALCKSAPERAFAYAQEHFSLLYDPDCLRRLLPLAARYAPEEEESLRARLSQLEALPEPDVFTQAVTEMDLTAIQDFINHPERLSGAGYSEAEISRLGVAFTDGEYPSGADVFSTARRLNRFFGNRGRLAERFLWMALANEVSPQAEVYSLLLTFMADEDRWEECRRFYERYGSRISNIPGEQGYLCRGMYLLSLINVSRSDAPKKVLSDLVPALYLLADARPSVQETIARYAGEDGAADAPFWKALLEEVLPLILSRPVLHTVALLDHFLERTMLQQDALVQGGVSPQQAEKAKRLYQEKSFCLDPSAGGTALRIFQFLGDSWGAAGTLAQFALRPEGESPDSSAVQTLWGLAEGNQAARFELLVKYPTLQTSHPDAYLSYLFHEGSYREFLNHYNSESSSDPLDVVRRFIALQNVEPDSRAALPEELSQLDWAGPLGRRLFDALAKSGRKEELETLLCENFDTWLVTLPPELLKSLVQSAASDREGLRARAAERGQEALAVYCSNILNVQSADDLCEKYYKQALLDCAKLAGSVQESAGRLQALARLYPQREEEIRDQIVPQRIRVLIEEGRTEDAAAAIRVQVSSKPVLQQVFTSLKDVALCREEPLRTALSDASVTLDAQRDCLCFFHRLSSGKPSRDFLSFLFKLYLQALDRDAFPEELTAEAENLCLNNVKTLQSDDVLLCLMRLSGLAGHREEQEYALACLSMRVTDLERRKQIPELSDDQIQVNIAELFRQILRQRDPEGILRFFDFCETLTDPAQPSGAPGEEDAASLQKLFAAPGNDRLWLDCKEKLLSTEAPAAVEKYLSLACQKAPKLYDSYVTHCLQNRLYAPLLPALLRWAGSNFGGSCLTRLSQELDRKPDLFRALTEDAALTQDGRTQRQKDLLALVDVLCEVSAQPERRTAKCLGELIHVAVKAGTEQALNLFLERFSHTLFEWNGEELSLVLICRLLLDGRFHEAYLQLQTLSGLPGGSSPYLAKTLCALSGEEELRQWTDDECRRLLLTLPLPDGTRYDGPEKINTLILKAVPSGLELRLLQELKELFSDTELSGDYGLCAAQFILAASAPSASDPQADHGRISILYHSLRSLLSSDLKSESKSFYRRDRADNAQALALLGAAMESDRTEEITDLCRDVFGSDAYGNGVLKQVGDLLKLRDNFINQDDGTKSLLYLIHLGLVTGNWRSLLEQGWRLNASLQKLPIPRLKKMPGPESAGPDNQKAAGPQPVSPFGFFRSALQVIFSLESDRRESFLLWLEGSIPGQLCGPEALKLLREFSQEHLEHLIEDMGAQPVAELLSYPIEYPSLGRAIVQGKLLPLMKEYPSCRYELALLAGACADHDNLISSLEKRAVRSFTLCEKENFLAASQIYRALEQLCPLGRRHRLYNSDGTEILPTSSDPRYYPSLYHARYLLCGALGGDEFVLSSIFRDNFPLYACINLFLELSFALRNSKYRLTTEACHGLLGGLTGETREIARALLLFKNSEASDEEKVKFLNGEDRFSDNAWLYLCFLLKYPYGRQTKQGLDERCFSLKRSEVAADLNGQYIAKCNRHYVPADFLLYVDFKPSPKWDSLYKEYEKLLSAQAPRAVAEGKAIPHPTLLPSGEEEAPSIPDYAKDLEPLDEIPDLKAEYQKYLSKWITGPNARRSWGEDSLAQRLGDSERLCRAALSGDVSSRRLSRCLLFYGVDLYNCRQKDADRAEQLRLFKSFMSLPLSTLSSFDCRGAVQTVLTGGAVQNLFAAQDSIDALLADFDVHRPVYQNIVNMSSDSQRPYFETLYSVLDTLAFELSQAANDGARKTALEKALDTLPKANGAPWWNVVPAVRPLIIGKTRLLNDRPELEIHVLNPKDLSYPCKGVLSGLVTNRGARPAEKIVLTLRCNGEQSRQEYVLSRISKGAAAAFELPYALSDRDPELHWEIEISYHDMENSYNGVFSGTLLLSGSAEDLSSQYAGVPFYNTDTISSFQIVDGEPTNPGFIGRETEKNMLKGLFSEPTFSGYGNAILYGIRRAGKTSLLNYAQEYIEANHPEILLVSADCRKLAVGEPVIWKAFVKPCLEKAKMLPSVGGSEELRALEEDWSVPAPTQLQPNPDVSIDELGYFFDRLRAITGMGCYLFLDETDNLFQILESNHSLDKLITTLQSLSNDHKKSFHFVLCGSTWFLRQLSEGPNTRQLLHHVTQIEVGRLTKPETEELLRTAEKKDLPLKITKEAADAVWNFTGGLAWFVKLVGNKAAERTTSGNRTILYPYDILEVSGGLVNETNCEVLHDGVDEHDGAFDVLLALQAMTPDQSTYIPEDALCKLSGLDKDESAFYAAMELLKKLKLIECEDADPPRWHFTLDIYRRYFRKYAKGRVASDEQVEDTRVLFKKRL